MTDLSLVYHYNLLGLNYIIQFSNLMEDESELSAAYSQEEVIWAKIQGHPWWPAFIDQVHSENDGEIEYTVNFFGDNTNSRLGASKLNKFTKFYADHYPKAKSDRRLKASLTEAQQMLKENDQNIQIFENIRQELKQKGRWGNKAAKGGRHRSSSNESDQIEELPRLKTITSTCSRTSRSKARVKKTQDKGACEKQQLSKINSNLPVKRQKNNWNLPKEFAEDACHKQLFQNHQTIINEEGNRANDGLELEPRCDDLEKNPVKKEECIKEELEITVSIEKTLKRGRPKKNISLQNLNDAKQNNGPNPMLSFLNKRKPIHKATSVKRVSFKTFELALSELDLYIIQSVRQLLGNREGLIDFLTEAAITTNNVQEILELGVVDILKEGDDYKQVWEIITMLKDTLVLKYFPNDGKLNTFILKNVRREKKNTTVAAMCLRGKKEQPEQRKKEQESLIPRDCRRKTVVKLFRFLSRDSELLDVDTAKELSIQIQDIFYLQDNSVGQRYKHLALKILSALKEGSTKSSDVIRKLKEKAFD